MKAVYLIFGGLFFLKGCGGGEEDLSIETNIATDTTTNAPAPAPTTSNNGNNNSSDNNTVTYRVTFSTIWSAETFATQYPVGRHFSPLVGMTHNEQSDLWIPSGLATDGMEEMAETGATLILNPEIDDVISQNFAQFRLNGPGVSSIVDSIDMEFEITDEFPLLTLVSMVAPSPDWFVGVRSFDLRDENGNWRSSVTVNLPVYDAGTDSGETFNASNLDTDPREPIVRLTTDASASDFADGVHRDTGVAIARFSFTLL